MRRLTLLAMAMLVAGCGSDAARTGPAAPRTSLAFVAQPDGGASLATLPRLQVAVLDAQGNIAAHISDTITLSAVTADAALSGTLSAVTDQGVATFADITLGRATAHRLRAVAARGDTALSQPIHITAGPPARLAFVALPERGTATLVLEPAVRVGVQDAAGNPLPASGDSVTVSLAESPDGAALAGTRTAVTVNGVATFADLRIDQVGAGYKLAADAKDLDPAVSDLLGVAAAIALRRTTLALAYQQACALTPAGAAWCWGDNSNGALGDGRPVTSPVPYAVAGGHRFATITAAEHHTCGLDFDRRAWCWGFNPVGELGVPAPPFQWWAEGPAITSEPVAVVGDHRFTALDATTNQTCGLTAAGEVWCWGAGVTAAFSWSDGTSSFTPVRVPGSIAFNTISVGEAANCALTAGGTAYCWTRYDHWTLGAGMIPGAIPGSYRFQSLTGGSCGLTTDGLAMCFQTPSFTPVDVGGGRRFTAFNVHLRSPWADLQACGVSDGETWCWISGNAPAAVSHSGGLAGVNRGSAHACGLDAAGGARCWGVNTHGQLGDGSYDDRSQATAVQGAHAFSSLSAGGHHTCALDPSDQAWCWGGNPRGELGDGHPIASPVPVEVTGGHTFAAIVAGDGHHACALKENGEAWCWGANRYGQLGTGDTLSRSEPARVSGGRSFVRLAAGWGHTCAVTAAGAAWCWGRNRGQSDEPTGQLGNGTAEHSSVPVAVAGGHLFSTVSAGAHNSCGLTLDGQAWCWGWQFVNQLLPKMLDGSQTFADLYASDWKACGLSASGAAFCWSGHWPTPARVQPGLFSVYAPSEFHSCGVTGGQAVCWGYNWFGQLGDGTTTNSTVQPVVVKGGHDFVSLVSTGGNQSCGLTSSGEIWCWGQNNSGSLGNGTFLNSGEPVRVGGGVVFASPVMAAR